MNSSDSSDSSSSSSSQSTYPSHFLFFVELFVFLFFCTVLSDSICLEVLMSMSSSGKCFPSSLTSDCLIVDSESMVSSSDCCAGISGDFGVFVLVVTEEKVRLVFWDVLLSMVLTCLIDEKVS